VARQRADPLGGAVHRGEWIAEGEAARPPLGQRLRVRQRQVASLAGRRVLDQWLYAALRLSDPEVTLARHWCPREQWASVSSWTTSASWSKLW
jgi:hypothetical protein